MVTSGNDTEATTKHIGPSGREFDKKIAVPYCSLSSAQKRVLPESVLAGIATTPETSLKRLQSAEVVPREGAAIRVQAGTLVRLTLSGGPQIIDVNVWNADDPAEHFSSSVTRQIQTSHLSTGDSLWSCMPYVRPLVTLTADSLGYGLDEDGAGLHGVIGSQCDPYSHLMMTGESLNDTCQSNLVRAAISQGLKEKDVHEAFSVFACTGFSKDKGVFIAKPTPAAIGDYIDLFAQVNVIVGVSVCRQGAGGTACGDTPADQICYPLGVDVYEIPVTNLEEWSAPKVSAYAGQHGITEKADDS